MPSTTACLRREGNEQLAALAGCRPLLSNCHGQPLRHSPLDPVSGPYRLKAEGDDEERVAARRSFHLPQRPARALRPFLVVGRAAYRLLAQLREDLARRRQRLGIDMVRRSEEHSSELQSLMRTSYAFFCLK